MDPSWTHDGSMNHASTAMSSGLGMAIARDLMKKKNNVICVVGDGAMSGGMAYEAMNNAGAMKSKLIVILNVTDVSMVLILYLNLSS
mgnify:CR=1 FL=1